MSMHSLTISSAKTPLAGLLRSFITRQAELTVELSSVLRDLDDLAFRSLRRRRSGERSFG